MKMKTTQIKNRNEEIWKSQGPDDYTPKAEINSTDFEWLYSTIIDLINELEKAEQIPVVEFFDKRTGEESVWLRQTDIAIEVNKLAEALQEIADGDPLSWQAKLAHKVLNE